MSSPKISELMSQILERLDIREEYKKLGVIFTEKPTSAKGWMECHAFGREDKNPSACVHCETGVYKDSAGPVHSLINFAVHCGAFGNWKDARKHYAIIAKLEKHLPKSTTKEDCLLDKFNFHAGWNGLLVKGLINAYPGIDEMSLRRAGAQLAAYPKNAPHPDLTVAVPIYGLHLTDQPPVAYCVMLASGKELELYQGKDVPPKVVKRAVINETGMMGRRGLEMIIGNRATLVIKVEGFTDMLAMQVKLTGDYLDKIAVVTNACGTHETTLPGDIAPAFSGVPTVIIHDADVPGQIGAKIWVSEFSKFTRVVNVRLPYVVEPKKGKDLRDWLNEGNGIEELLTMIEQQHPGWLAGGDPTRDEIVIVDESKASKPAKTTNQDSQSELPFDVEPKKNDSSLSTPTANSKAAKTNVAPNTAISAGPTVSTGGGLIATQKDNVAFDHSHDVFIPELTQEAANLKRIGLIVLGMPEGSEEFVCFNETNGRTFTLKKLEHMKIVHLYMHLGREIDRQVLRPGENGVGSQKMTLDNVRDAIAIEGQRTRLTGKSYFGVGIWEFSGRLLMVNSGEATVVNGKVSRTKVPKQDGRIFDFGSGGKWFDHDWFAEEFEKNKDSKYSQSVFKESVAVFNKWDNWGHANTPEIITALVCATWIQSVWDWRPQACVVGATNSGKTSFLSVLRNMFCRGEMQIGGMHPTAASIRQDLKNTMKAIIIDEFEKHSKHREDVLAMLRGASRGETVSRGTSNQKGMSFTLKHLPWHGAISADFREAADRNRYLMIELKTIPEDRGSTLQLPSADEMHQLGLKLMAVAVSKWKKAKELANTLKKVFFKGIDRRIVESFSVPCGIIAAIFDMSLESAELMMRDVLMGRDFDDQSESDEQSLLQAIYESTVSVETTRKSTISMLIEEMATSRTGCQADKAMQRHGIRYLPEKETEKHPEGEPCIFFVEKAICSNLFTDPAKKSIGVKQILLRVQESFKDKQQLGAHNPRGVTIPLRVLRSLLGYSYEEKPKNVGEISENTTTTIQGTFTDAMGTF